MVITQAAKEEILKHAKFLKIIAVPGGCAGLQYELAYTNTKGDDIELCDCVLTDTASRELIEPITIDFIDELGSREFLLSNPNKKSCGCGNSFGT